MTTSEQDADIVTSATESQPTNSDDEAAFANVVKDDIGDTHGQMFGEITLPDGTKMSGPEYTEYLRARRSGSSESDVPKTAKAASSDEEELERSMAAMIAEDNAAKATTHQSI